MGSLSLTFVGCVEWISWRWLNARGETADSAGVRVEGAAEGWTPGE